MRFLTVLVLLLIPALVVAGPNAGGVLLVHANSSLVYTSDTTSYCGQSGLAACSLAVTSVPWDPETTTVFYVLAAFPATSSPRLKAITWGVDWDDSKLVILDHGSCSDFDIPDGTWPAPGTGIGQSFLETRTGLLTELYWLAGYGYAEGETLPFTSFVLTPHPHLSGEFADDSVHAAVDTVAEFGRLGFGEVGSLPCFAGNAEGDGIGTPDEAGGQDAPGEQGGDGDVGGDDVPGLPDVPSLAYVEIVPTTGVAFSDIVDRLEQDYGLRVLVSFVPDGIICRATEAQLVAASQDSDVTMATGSRVSSAPPLSETGKQPGDAGLGRSLWNEILEPPTGESEPPELSYSCIESDSAGGRWLPQANPDYQTSIYMMGHVGLSLVFLESSTSGICEAPDRIEDWPLDAPAIVYAKVIAGLVGLSDYTPYADLDFQICEFVTAETSVEMVQAPTAQVFRGGLSEAYAHMGFATGTYLERALQCNNVRRTEWSKDWYFTAFAVCAICDDDGCVAYNGLYGWAFNNFGPYIVFTAHYGNQWDWLDWVVAHESAHVFGAMDEGASSLCEATCNTIHGYLHVPNQNCWSETCNDDPVPCLMAGTGGRPFKFCDFSQGQLGWQDEESGPDAVLDPIQQPGACDRMFIKDSGIVPGNWVDIYTTLPQELWVKRIGLTKWNSDGEVTLWDGYDYRGDKRCAGTYLIKGNGEGPGYLCFLEPETEAPEIVAPSIVDGSPPRVEFRIGGAGTEGARVRVTVKRTGRPDRIVLRDEFRRAPAEYEPPVTVDLELGYGQGLYTVEIRAWGSGGGRTATATLQYVHGGTGGLIDDNETSSQYWTVSPNPASGTVKWKVASVGSRDDRFLVVGVDGRVVRALRANVEGNETWVRWDGKDERGTPAAAGKYYLVKGLGRSGRKIGGVVVLR